MMMGSTGRALAVLELSSYYTPIQYCKKWRGFTAIKTVTLPTKPDF